MTGKRLSMAMNSIDQNSPKATPVSGETMEQAEARVTRWETLRTHGDAGERLEWLLLLVERTSDRDSVDVVSRVIQNRLTWNQE